MKHPLAKYRPWRKDSNLPNLRDSENAVIIGHSSGADLALIYAEHHKVAGLVLFAPYDKANTGGILGTIFNPLEKASGMFTTSDPAKKGILYRKDRKFKWDKIVKNCGFIIVAHASGDDTVPGEFSKSVSDKLKEAASQLTDYRQGNNKIVYVPIEGSGHHPETKQFSVVMSHIPVTT